LKVLIMGCGRVGSTLATTLDSEGHEVTIIDLEEYAFRRLGASFRGKRVIGNAIDQDILHKAGAERMDVFVAVTQGDNRNIMASQIVKHLYGVPRVLCRIYDPIREEVFNELGLETFSPTRVGADLMRERLLGTAG
jgi:trk system potassium uptake protein TrkA